MTIDCLPLYAGLPSVRLASLERIQRSAARLTGKIPKFGHVTGYMLEVDSFIQAISITPLQVHTTQRRSHHSTDTVSEFHIEAPQATASEGLAQGPNVAATAVVKPMTL